MVKEDRAFSEGKSFADYMVKHAKKDSGGRDTVEI